MKSIGKKYDLSTDTTAAITELSSLVLEPSEPATIGRQLVRTIETTSSSIKIRRPRKGTAVKSGRGEKGASKGRRNDYITLTPEDEIEASDKWDRQFLEDAEYDVAAEEARGLGGAYDIEETDTIIKFLSSIPAANLAGGEEVAAENPGTFTYDDIVNLWDKVASADNTSNLVAMHPNQFSDLLKQDDFKNNQIFGDYLDIRQGRYGGLILGLQILVSSLMPKRSVFVMDSSKVGLFCLRRDKILQGFQPNIKEFEMQVTSRYTIKTGLPEAFARMTNA